MVGLRAFGRRHRVPITLVGSLFMVAALAFALAGRRHEFAAALSEGSVRVLGATIMLQIVALLARTGAWPAAGSIARRACRCSAA
jgi:hypothetical protein